MASWEGRRVFVTGATSGIGRAVALRLRDEGAEVIGFGRRPGPEPGIRWFQVDVADPARVQAAVEEVLTGAPSLDALINCAGTEAVGTVEQNDDDEWARVLSVNVTSVARVTRACLPWLRRSDQAAVVNTSSVVAWAGVPNRVLYSASKGAIQSMTLAMAADLIGSVRVNCVCPGTIDTPWIERLLARTPDPAGERARLTARQPMGRLGTAEEVAATICWLASPDASFVTGTAIAVDGGMHGLRVTPPASPSVTPSAPPTDR